MVEPARDGVRLPAYRDLPLVEGGARSAWHLFGAEDSLGLMNLLTAGRIVDAVRLVRRGAVFPLDVRSDYLHPALFGRGAPRRTTFELRGGVALDDVHDNVYPQAGSQWDAIGHVAFAPDRFYNGRTLNEVRSGALTIDHWAARGIVARTVVLDLAEVVDARGGPGASVSLGVTDLDEALRAARIEVHTGDVLLLHTGFLQWYGDQDAATRARMSRRDLLTAPGLEHSEEMAEYLWDLHVPAVVTDGPAVEVWPPDERPEAWPFGFLHQILLGQFGMGLGELWWLYDLVEDCRRTGSYDALLISAPMNTPGGLGSPANALAIR
ncbi:cyclase family protein [Plantactinospora solaniradicis]|uniref:Cyclase family protein n=1 Tax=Plantactinospora solaniradicis TaxID=1723736 RepID=A0ABW1KB42_9ACTN